MSGIFTILELLKLIVDLLKFLKGEINEATYLNKMRSIKKLHDEVGDKKLSLKERLERLKKIEEFYNNNRSKLP